MMGSIQTLEDINEQNKGTHVHEVKFWVGDKRNRHRAIQYLNKYRKCQKVKYTRRKCRARGTNEKVR